MMMHAQRCNHVRQTSFPIGPRNVNDLKLAFRIAQRIQ